MSFTEVIATAGGVLGIATAIYVFAVMRVRNDIMWQERAENGEVLQDIAVLKSQLDEVKDGISELRQFTMRRGRAEAEVRRAVRAAAE